MHLHRVVSGVVLALVGLAADAPADWKAAPSPLSTPWAADVDPKRPLPEYPRPQLVRSNWINLNGLWDYAILSREAGTPAAYDGEILVPFAVESSLSGVQRAVQPDQSLWYRRTFPAPARDGGERILLHFGAVDWQADVFVNGRMVGSHRGGFDPFSFDITDALTAEGDQELVVRVWDPTDIGSQPRGKQVLRPGGIFYTAVTGIWQTVWLEAVPQTHIDRLTISSQLDGGRVAVTVHAAGPAGGTVELRVTAEGEEVASARGVAGEVIEIPIENVRAWTPDDPFLYDLEATLRSGESRDTVASYFGMRSIAVGKDEHGINRLLLNGEPLFQYGLLDQGWWPDGLFTAPTDEALRYDVEITKQMGFNMIRKHVKVEPARWYHWCDKLGILVWQDMPTLMASGGGEGVAWGAVDDARVGEGVRRQFRRELGAMVGALAHHPSIVVWVPFNEGWGQHDTNDVLRWVKELDPSRLVDGPSGWEDRGFGNMKDVHSYPGPRMFPVIPDRASVLGEFGGLGLPVRGHLWQDSDNWGYRTYGSEIELRDHYEALIQKTRLFIRQGLAAAVYTQTTDVEGEVNGLLTYDRRVRKLEPDWLRKTNAALYAPAAPLELAPLAATSEEEAYDWRFTTSAPGEQWFAADFDAASWPSAPAPFGTPGIAGLEPRTDWEGSAIWMRRDFTLDAAVSQPVHLRAFHDDTMTVYINGVKAAELRGFNQRYELFTISPEAAATLRPGRNVIAVECRQDQGPQGVDVGLFVEVGE